MTERTLGQKVEQWLTNLKLIIPIVSLLGLSSIYGNSETVKNMVHGKPEIAEPVVVEVKQVKPVEHKHDNHNARFSKIESQITKLRRWHE